jgi:hypothetical protein
MKTLTKIIGIISFLVSSTVFAQEKKTVEIICDDSEKIFKTLSEEYGEQPIVFGKKDKSSNLVMSLWFNPTTESWTLIATDPAKTCVIIAGEGMIIQAPRKSGTPL